MSTAAYMIDGPVVAPGSTLGDSGSPLHVKAGSREREHWYGATVVELHGKERSPARALSAWANVDDGETT